MITPIRFADVQLAGWYLFFDSEERPDGGTLCCFDPTDELRWRNARGCGDVGPFDDDELVVGPMDLRYLKHE